MLIAYILLAMVFTGGLLVFLCFIDCAMRLVYMLLPAVREWYNEIERKLEKGD